MKTFLNHPFTSHISNYYSTFFTKILKNYNPNRKAIQTLRAIHFSFQGSGHIKFIHGAVPSNNLLANLVGLQFCVEKFLRFLSSHISNIILSHVNQIIIVYMLVQLRS